MCLLTASLLLAACGDEPEVARETGGSAEAEGDVLGGSISDAMLPLESVQSQSPPLREAPTNSTTSTSLQSSSEGSTAVENTVETTSGDTEAETPEPPPPPEAEG